MNVDLNIENIKETAMVDVAHELLRTKGEPMMYDQIMNEVAAVKEFTEDEVELYIAQLYTEINIDGRFTCVGRSQWGLKDWYPIDQTTESAVAANVKDDYLDDDLLVDPEIYGEDSDVFVESSVEIDDLDDDIVEDDEVADPVLDAEVAELDGELDDELDEEDEDEDDFEEDDEL